MRGIAWWAVVAVGMVVVAGAAGAWVSCGVGSTEVRLPEGEPFARLSEYNLFTGRLADLKPNTGVLPYDLNSPLFSDYAHKFRTVWMPKGKSAVYNDSVTLEFPEGTLITKTFYYPANYQEPDGKRNIIETRVLLRQASGWVSLPYIWNQDQTDATLEVTGEQRQVSWNHTDGTVRTANYTIPNVNQCKGCHGYKNVLLPIGPKIRNLNKTYPYADGPMNQLDKWAQLGYLTGYTSAAASPRLAQWDDPSSGSLDERARAWLEINCAHCHNPHGAGGTSGLNLLASVKDPMAYGICKSPVAAGRGSGGFSYDIAPGEPEKSILIYRLETNDPGRMMPELGRSVVHEESVALLKEWIRAMPKNNCDARGL